MQYIGRPTLTLKSTQNRCRMCWPLPSYWKNVSIMIQPPSVCSNAVPWSPFIDLETYFIQSRTTLPGIDVIGTLDFGLAWEPGIILRANYVCPSRREGKQLCEHCLLVARLVGTVTTCHSCR